MARHGREAAVAAKAVTTLAAVAAVCIASTPTVAAAVELPDGLTEIARAELRRGSVVLAADGDGDGHLFRVATNGRATPLPCERLPGAFGVWLDDLDGDGRAEVLVALRKRARFDPIEENRLHVFGVEAGGCVPAWRGTRLAGRFERLAIPRRGHGELLSLERVAGSVRRIARYRWTGFGYAVEAVLWRGEGLPPSPWAESFGLTAAWTTGGQR